MHLKEAREKKKIGHLIEEHGKDHPKTRKRHFHAVLKSMSAGIQKPKEGTSPARSRDD
jgi:hypothetical protein